MSLAVLETKAAVRHIKTHAGEKKYGGKIGDVIVRDLKLPHLKVIDGEYEGVRTYEGTDGQNYLVGKESLGWYVIGEQDLWDDIVLRHAANEEEALTTLDGVVGAGKRKKDPYLHGSLSVHPDEAAYEKKLADLSKQHKALKAKYGDKRKTTYHDIIATHLSNMEKALKDDDDEEAEEHLDKVRRQLSAEAHRASVQAEIERLNAPKVTIVPTGTKPKKKRAWSRTAAGTYTSTDGAQITQGTGGTWNLIYPGQQRPDASFPTLKAAKEALEHWSPAADKAARQLREVHAKRIKSLRTRRDAMTAWLDDNPDHPKHKELQSRVNTANHEVEKLRGMVREPRAGDAVLTHSGSEYEAQVNKTNEAMLRAEQMFQTLRSAQIGKGEAYHPPPKKLSASGRAYRATLDDDQKPLFDNVYKAKGLRAAKKAVKPPEKVVAPETYRGSHQPPSDSATIDDAAKDFPDVYEHPDYYWHSGEDYDKESAAVLKRVQGKPNAMVTVYRAVPPGVTKINPGDWVAISKAYAERHSFQNDNPDDDWPVISMQVPANTIHNGGNDIVEWGYWPKENAKASTPAPKPNPDVVMIGGQGLKVGDKVKSPEWATAKITVIAPDYIVVKTPRGGEVRVQRNSPLWHLMKAKVAAPPAKGFKERKMLAIQERVAELLEEKDFNPNQPRDRIGRWSKVPGKGIVSTLKKYTANVYPTDPDAEWVPRHVEAIDTHEFRDRYLPSVFGEPDDVTSRERRVFHPVLDGGMEKKPKGFNEGPPVFAQYEQDPEMVKKFGEGFANWTFQGKTTPITHVYRGMSIEEWNQAQQRGYIQSDERGTILPGWEGTNAGVGASTAWSYLPRNGQSIIAKIRVDPEDQWFTSDADSYLRTRARIPVDRIMATTGVLTTDNGHITSIEEHDQLVEEFGKNDLSNPDTPRTRAVTPQEFQALAVRGKARLEGFRKNASDPKGLDDNFDSIAEQGWKSVQEEWGGLTVNAHTGLALKGNENVYALTVKPRGMDSVSVPIGASQEEFTKAMREARERFANELRNERHYLGIFRDEDSNRIDFDPVLIVSNLDDVETIGVYTRSVGGAYNFADGNGYWPPYVEEGGMKDAGLQGTGTVAYAGGESKGGGAESSRERAWRLTVEAAEAKAEEGLEVKAVVRHVRTPEGEKRYGQPIGSIIVADAKLPNLKIDVDSIGPYGYAVEGANGREYSIRKTGKGHWYAEEQDTGDAVANASDEGELLISLNLLAKKKPPKKAIAQTPAIAKAKKKAVAAKKIGTFAPKKSSGYKKAAPKDAIAAKAAYKKATYKKYAKKAKKKHHGKSPAQMYAAKAKAKEGMSSSFYTSGKQKPVVIPKTPPPVRKVKAPYDPKRQRPVTEAQIGVMDEASQSIFDTKKHDYQVKDEIATEVSGRMMQYLKPEDWKRFMEGNQRFSYAWDALEENLPDLAKYAATTEEEHMDMWDGERLQQLNWAYQQLLDEFPGADLNLLTQENGAAKFKKAAFMGWLAGRADYAPDHPEKMSSEQLALYSMASRYMSAWASSSGDGDALPCAIQYRAAQVFDIKNVETSHLTPIDKKTPGYSGETPQSKINVEGAFMDAYLRSVYENTQDMFKRKGIKEVTIHRGMDFNYIKDAPPIKKKPPEGMPQGKELRAWFLAQSNGLPSSLFEQWSYARRKFKNTLPKKMVRDWGVSEEWAKAFVVRNDFFTLTGRNNNALKYPPQPLIVPLSSQPLSSWASNPNIARQFGSYRFSVTVPVENVWSTAVTGSGCLNETEYVLFGGRGKAAVTQKW